MARHLIFSLLLYIVTFVVTTIPLAMIKLNISTDIIPIFELYIIYFSVLYYPVSILQIFIYGFFVDEIYGSLSGLHSTLFITGSIILSKVKFLIVPKKPLSSFFGFSILTIIFAMSKYLILVYIFGYYASLLKISLQVCNTILLYPMAYFLFSKILKIHELYVK